MSHNKHATRAQAETHSVVRARSRRRNRAGRSAGPTCGDIVARSARRNSGAEANEVYSSRPRRRSSSNRTAGRRVPCVAASGAARMQWTWAATRHATHQLPRRSSHSCTRSSRTGEPNHENGHPHWRGHNGDDSSCNPKCHNGREQRSPGRRDCRAISTAGVSAGIASHDLRFLFCLPLSRYLSCRVNPGRR